MKNVNWTFVGWCFLMLAGVPGLLASPLLENASFSATKHGAKTFRLPLKAEDAELSVSGRMWASNVVSGVMGHENARVQVTFHDVAGKQVGGWPASHAVRSGSVPWQSVVCRWTIPVTAREARLSLCNWGKKGSVGFDGITARVTRARQLARCNAPLPEGAPRDPWTLDGAWKTSSEVRTRYSLNGLWGARPVLTNDVPNRVPGENDLWGWGKIPGMWYGDGVWSQQAQEFVYSPWFLDNLEQNPVIRDACWYRRRFRLPAEAKGRRVSLWFDLVNTQADVYVDGVRAGRVMFPGGSVDLTALAKPGVEQEIAIRVESFFLDWAVTWANDEGIRLDKKKTRKSDRVCRGITGDLYLDLLPAKPVLDEAYVETSVARGELTVCAALLAGAPAPSRLRAEVRGCGATRTFEGAAEKGPDGTYRFTAAWPDAKLWDLHTPSNVYTCTVTALDAGGRSLDASLPFTFGFREIVQKGRDWLLNGRPVHLRTLYSDASRRHAALSSKAACLEACRRARDMGFNTFIAGNYSCQAGAVSYLEGIMEACDETGVLYAYSLPNTREFNNDLTTADARDRYARLTREMVRRARHHPSVCFYAMNHNNTGYTQEQNPCRMDGVRAPVPSSPQHAKARAAGMTAAEIARAVDSTRVVYHHCSGLLSNVHCTECYLNWAPVQERSDWMEQWSTKSVVPHFIVEYGMPLTMSWFSYRWPKHILQASAYQHLWMAEYAASFFGERAYEPTETLRAANAAEQDLFHRGEPYFYWQLSRFLTGDTNCFQNVESLYAADNWRCFRAWKLTGCLPWGQDAMWRRVTPFKAFAPKSPEFRVDRWQNLKGRGPVADFVRCGQSYWDDPGARSDWTETVWGETMRRWNRDEIAFIGGGDVFTEKDHHFRPEAPFRKQLVLVNDAPTARLVQWRVEGCGQPQTGDVRVAAGDVAFVPLSFVAPRKSGRHALTATFAFADGTRRTDAFTFEVYAPAPKPPRRVALYDPKGLTRATFDRLGIAYDRVDDVFAAATNGCRLVIGRECLTREIFDRAVVPDPNFYQAFHGHVLIFEQDYATLASIGFRAQEYGMRNVFPRYADADFPKLDADALRDWNGEATLTTPYYENIPYKNSRYFTEPWGPFQNTRVWRCRNRGNVASVLPEKPGAGAWHALVDGAFDLEYAPLLEWVAQGGRILFCQLDVTARTRPDPVADNLVCRLVTRLTGAVPVRTSPPAVLGFDAGWHAFNSFLDMPADMKSPVGNNFVVSSGAKKPKDFAARIAAGGRALLAGLTAEELKAWCPVDLRTETRTNAWVNPVLAVPLPPELNGLSVADIYQHARLDYVALTDERHSGCDTIRVIRHGKGTVVVWSLPPWKIPTDRQPALRTSRRHACSTLGLILGNLGFRFNPRAVFYFDNAFSDDDPYRYWRW